MLLLLLLLLLLLPPALPTATPRLLAVVVADRVRQRAGDWGSTGCLLGSLGLLPGAGGGRESALCRCTRRRRDQVARDAGLHAGVDHCSVRPIEPVLRCSASYSPLYRASSSWLPDESRRSTASRSIMCWMMESTCCAAEMEVSIESAAVASRSPASARLSAAEDLDLRSLSKACK